MTRNVALVEAARLAEQNMDVFRRALLQKAERRLAGARDRDEPAAETAREGSQVERPASPEPR